MKIKVFDLGDKVMDRYTVLFIANETLVWTLSTNCNLSNGDCLYVGEASDEHQYNQKIMGERVSIKSLPVTVRNKIKELKAMIIAERKEV